MPGPPPNPYLRALAGVKQDSTLVERVYVKGPPDAASIWETSEAASSRRIPFESHTGHRVNTPCALAGCYPRSHSEGKRCGQRCVGVK
jgi:hypothetical protein